MHGVMWGIHRTSLCAIKVAKRIAARFGLTPSRFHMLFAIHCERLTWFPQKALRVLLGVSAQTISRMIQSLMKSGLLLKRVMVDDRRRRELAFTEECKEVMRRAVGEIVLGGLGTHVAGRALTDQGWPASLQTRRAAVAEADELFNRLRHGLLDNAFFSYDPENGEPEPALPKFLPAYHDCKDSTPDLTTLDHREDEEEEACLREPERPSAPTP
jgi:DNA-binding MarR family transcriptional regulator